MTQEPGETTEFPLPRFTDRDILSWRSAKNDVSFDRPYAFMAEPERSSEGFVEQVATIFLTNRECPFRCLMCDLWRNTRDELTPPGAIPRQIEFALQRLPKTRVIKLYNSGNFFDAKAIPPTDLKSIAGLVQGYRTVIVENHPRLCGDVCLDFQGMIDGELEIAMGLETIHPEVLPRLNKRMTLDDFAKAAKFLRSHGVSLRTFILLRAPGLSESEGVEWAVRSVRFAIDAGVRCCALVPTRAGNGVMEHLQDRGIFAPPTLRSIEDALDQSVSLGEGRVFMDLWDLQKFSRCDRCFAQRRDRLERINHTQLVSPRIVCSCETLEDADGSGDRT